jgi:hypothetical protein
LSPPDESRLPRRCREYSIIVPTPLQPGNHFRSFIITVPCPALRRRSRPAVFCSWSCLVVCPSSRSAPVRVNQVGRCLCYYYSSPTFSFSLFPLAVPVRRLPYSVIPRPVGDIQTAGKYIQPTELALPNLHSGLRGQSTTQRKQQQQQQQRDKNRHPYCPALPASCQCRSRPAFAFSGFPAAPC